MHFDDENAFTHDARGYFLGQDQVVFAEKKVSLDISYIYIEFLVFTEQDNSNFSVIRNSTGVKPTASRHAVTYGWAALTYGWSKTVRKCALPCGFLMNIHKIS